MHCYSPYRGVHLPHRQLQLQPQHVITAASKPWISLPHTIRNGHSTSGRQCLSHSAFASSRQLNAGRTAAAKPASSAHCWQQQLRNVTTTATTSSSSSSSNGAATAVEVSKFASPVVIIGGGPAGLATAVMLARRGYTSIKVYERLPEPPTPDDISVWGDFEQASERLYMIGLNTRGQAVLRDLELMERIDTASSLVLGRLDWRPDTPPDAPVLTRYTNRTYKTRCIQRDRLAACILQELRDKHGHAVSVKFRVKCAGVAWTRTSTDREVCQVTLQQQDSSSSSSSDPQEWLEQSSFLIGADGAGSALRDAMEDSSSSSSSSRDHVKVKRYKDTNVIVYRTIPLFWPKELADTRPGDLNYSARTKSGVNFDCLPTKEGPFIGVMLYKPGDKQIAALKTKEDVHGLFKRNFPAFLPAIREVDLERFAQKTDRNLPTFSYVGPSLHYGSSACLIGDAIHTVKPYFGQGVNSAFEDVKVLQQALEDTNDDPTRAVKRYSELRSKDAESLVVLSHSLDGGFLTFVGPLVLDSMLHKLLPQIFSPNIIASLQNEKWTFSRVRARKRVDRALQVGLLTAVLWAAVKVVSVLVGLASKYLSRFILA